MRNKSLGLDIFGQCLFMISTKPLKWNELTGKLMVKFITTKEKRFHVVVFTRN